MQPAQNFTIFIQGSFPGALNQPLSCGFIPEPVGLATEAGFIEDLQAAAVVQELLRTTSLPVRGVRPDKDKLTRFLPLAARYEQGLVKHAPGLPGWFEDELLSFPVGEHDDGADGLSLAWTALGMANPGGMTLQVPSL